MNGERVEVRLVLARFFGDTEPVVVGAIDRSIWDHWEEAEEAEWLAARKKDWGMDPSDCEWSQVWATFAPGDLVTAFATPVVPGEVAAVREP